MRQISAARQASLPGLCPVREAVAELAAAAGEQRKFLGSGLVSCMNLSDFITPSPANRVSNRLDSHI